MEENKIVSEINNVPTQPITPNMAQPVAQPVQPSVQVESQPVQMPVQPQTESVQMPVQPEPTQVTQVQPEQPAPVTGLNREEAMEEALSHTIQYTPFEAPKTEQQPVSKKENDKKARIFLFVILIILIIFIALLPTISNLFGWNQQIV